MKLMIVESPNKIKKLKSILGANWEVAASVGHVRDLPKKELGYSANGEPKYVFIPSSKFNGRTFPGGKERIAKIKALSKNAEHVYLATDPDREGEAIAWHLQVTLGLKEADYSRVTFGSISKEAVNEAISNCGKIDMPMVKAQEARRVLDRAFGYLVSPLMSDFLSARLSTGRVQSPAVRLVVEREREITNFKKTVHYGAKIEILTEGVSWFAEWDSANKLNGERYILDEKIAQEAVKQTPLTITKNATKNRRVSPPAPFSSSLLYQVASTKLKIDPEKMAVLAQKLFEQGAITYIRTDSVNFDDDSLVKIRAYATEQGHEVPDKARKFKTKGDVQEGHEAIRPDNMAILEAGENSDEQRLYKLIWQRTLASQMNDAVFKDQKITLNSNEDFNFKAGTSSLVSLGWKAVFIDEDSKDDKDNNSDLPKLDEGIEVSPVGGEVLEKQTKAPKRFTKASLIAKLESEGIGRPSTYPAIMKNIISKEYIGLKAGFLLPLINGEKVVDALIKGDFKFIDVSYTRGMESALDDIANQKNSFESVVPKELTSLKDEIESFESREGAPVRHFCPDCEAKMRRFQRKNKKGYIWICGAKECNKIMPDRDGVPVVEAVHTCPSCNKAPLRRFEKKDNGGYGWFCTDETCTTFLDDKNGEPIEQLKPPCPDCSKPMIRRKGDKGFWWGCSGYKEGCKKTMQDKNGKPI